MAVKVATRDATQTGTGLRTAGVHGSKANHRNNKLHKKAHQKKNKSIVLIQSSAHMSWRINMNKMFTGRYENTPKTRSLVLPGPVA